MSKQDTKINQSGDAFAIGRRKNVFSLRVLVTAALLAAIATVLQMIELPVPFVPPWLKIDISDVPGLMAAFAFGPIPAVAIEALKNLLNIALHGTTTGGIGELANFLVGSSMVIPAALVYSRNHSFKGAVFGMIAGVVSFCIMGVLLNIYLLMPFYMRVMGEEAIIGAASAINPIFNSVQNIVLYGVTPFNIFKAVLVSTVTLLIYKPLSPLLHGKK